MNVTEQVYESTTPVRGRWRWWLSAVRPITLTAAAIPVFTGSVLAYALTGLFSLPLFFFSIFCSFFIQVGTNLVNDALDFQKGVDREDRLGPLRVTQAGLLNFTQVLGTGVMCFVIALLLGIPLMIVGGFPIFLLILLSVLSGYFYTGGPYPLAYLGLGDFFVFLFFGILGTMGVYYIQAQAVSFASFVLGLQIGALATLLLAINNIRDSQGDRRAHKRTIAVRYGLHIAKMEITLLLLFPFVLNGIWVFFSFPFATVFPFATFPMGVWILLSIWRHEPSELYNRFLAQAALLHFFFGTLLAVGFLM